MALAALLISFLEVFVIEVAEVFGDNTMLLIR